MNKLRLLNTIKKPFNECIWRKYQVKIENDKSRKQKIKDNINKNTWNNKGENNNEWLIIVLFMFVLCIISSK